MIRNYITIALRNIRRNYSSAIINVAGLSLGITGTLVLYLLLSFLTSFDTFYPKGDRIYRLVHSFENRERLDYGAGIPNPLLDMIKKDVQGIEMVLPISGDEQVLITLEENGEKKFFLEENSFGWTDSLYFSFFNQSVLEGSGTLAKPNEILITKKLAIKFFGTDQVIGKRLLLNNEFDLEITGLLEQPRDNSSFPFKLLGSYETVRQRKLDEGMGSVTSDDQCFIMLNHDVDPSNITSQMKDLINKIGDEEMSKSWTYWLQPLSELHTDTRFTTFLQRSVSKESIWALRVIIFFLVMTACINFINLSTAVAIKRSKEVGVRKVLGGQRVQLIIQHLVETAFITLCALFLSVGLAELTLIKLNTFLDVNLHIDLTSQNMAIFLLALWVTVSLIAGLYPAFLLSKYKPVQALKNAMSNKSSSSYGLRRALVVFQFGISQMLIIGTVVILSQMHYASTKDLGFTAEAIVTVPVPSDEEVNKKKSLRDRIALLEGIEQVSLCYTPPTSGSVSITDVEIDDVEEHLLAQVKVIDEAYVPLFNLTWIAGHNISPSDTATGWIVNEKFVEAAGLTPEEIIGRKMQMWNHDVPVKGVVKNFHTLSMEYSIDPVVLFSDVNRYATLAVKIKPGQVNVSLPEIEKIWKEIYPSHLYSYHFLDDQIAEFYESTEKMSYLLLVFCLIAIIIGCLGLYGLVSYMANQKEKEIGIRKVMGASNLQILNIFSREFVVLMIVGFVIASPLSGYFMYQWLQNFQYHIPLSWMMFAAAIVITFLISMATIGYRSFKAAWTNPADVLRAE